MTSLPEPPTLEEIILVARTIGCRPTSLKAKVFAYFAKGYSLQELRLLLPRVKRETLRSYWNLWGDHS